MKLYSYWRSTAAWRVRLALELKGLDYEIQSVHLVADGGHQHKADYRALNPEGLVPCLVDGDLQLSQSLAICEYLEAQHKQTALLPSDPAQAAQVRAFCLSIACDIHPLNNLRVLQHLGRELNQNEDERNRWYQHWIAQGLAPLEQRLQASTAQDYCFGNEPGLADCFLIPQLYNARRFDCPLDAYPRLLDIDARCAQHPAFIRAHPDQQIDKA